jgi:hypothetical protein
MALGDLKYDRHCCASLAMTVCDEPKLIET